MGADPVIYPRLSLLTRLNYGARLLLFKYFVKLALGVDRNLLRPAKRRKVAPTYTKRYDVRPMLENRVFIPSSQPSGTKLPLYLNVHGGGFALCDPATDDEFCYNFANKYNICVISVDYRKAPQHPFPEPVYDVAELIKAILADPDLPIDHTKVAGGGFSAGGNLILAASTLVPGTLKALIPVYPVVDFSGKYKGEYKNGPDGSPDMLKSMSSLFNWGYLPLDQDRTDPLLSPIYADREKLPKNIFFVGAQYDYLAFEAEAMAKKLVGEDPFTVEKDHEWERDGVKWKNVLGQKHGFSNMELKGEQEIQRKAAVDQVCNEMADWLKAVLV